MQISYLNLKDNKLIGTLPTSWGSLPLLSSLSLDYNQGIIGMLPPSWATMGSNVPCTWICISISLIGTQLGNITIPSSYDLNRMKVYLPYLPSPPPSPHNGSEDAVQQAPLLFFMVMAIMLTFALH